MYTKRIQLFNYGPIEKLDIHMPFEGDNSLPIVFVGENGSGKSILLSHIVNGLISAKNVAFSESGEVDLNKVYKLRSNAYIGHGGEFSYGRVDFDKGLFVSEIRTRRNRGEYISVPEDISGTEVEKAWNKIDPNENDHYDSNFSSNTESRNNIKDLFNNNCVLYFPPNRFEEPAWLNERNLKAKAEYMNLEHLEGFTNRRVVDYSPLHDNQDWLFDLAYDRAVLELQTPHLNLPVNNAESTVPLPIFAGYSGEAANTYELALQIVRIVTQREDVRFGIGKRQNRVVSLEANSIGQLVPNIFQLSTGETSLLNLFLTLLRDFDLCNATFSSASDISGIVVVDEIDLHLHAIHQHEVLPKLMQMFPKVQFIVTTHSPLFVLGMNKLLGKDGFALYRLPQGHQISPEEFSEFGHAYQAFMQTTKYSRDVRVAIRDARRPVVFVEGVTDQKYIERAAQLLNRISLFQKIEVQAGGGKDNLKRVWKSYKVPMSDIIPQRILLLYDCEEKIEPNNKGEIFRRTIPVQPENPICKGIENLFSRSTLDKASKQNPAFIDIDPARIKTIRGEKQAIPDLWTVNGKEKTNLCNWLCEHGTAEDFAHFQVIFDLIEEILES